MMYPVVKCVLVATSITIVMALASGMCSIVYAQENDQNLTIKGVVQNQDLRRVDQAMVQVRDQEGSVVSQGVTNQAGEFIITVPQEGTYSISAVQGTYRSEYVIVKIGIDKPIPVTLTLAVTQEIAL